MAFFIESNVPNDFTDLSLSNETAVVFQRQPHIIDCTFLYFKIPFITRPILIDAELLRTRGLLLQFPN